MILADRCCHYILLLTIILHTHTIVNYATCIKLQYLDTYPTPFLGPNGWRGAGSVAPNSEDDTAGTLIISFHLQSLYSSEQRSSCAATCGTSIIKISLRKPNTADLWSDVAACVQYSNLNNSLKDWLMTKQWKNRAVECLHYMSGVCGGRKWMWMQSVCLGNRIGNTDCVTSWMILYYIDIIKGKTN